MQPDDADHRYTIRVYLYREGRPKYWSFYCPSCGKRLCEINGTMLYMTDLTSDMETSGMGGVIRIPCKQKFCRFWLEFNLN